MSDVQQPAPDVELSLAKVLDATPDMVGTITLEHRAIYLNRGGRRMLEVDDDEDPATLDVLGFYPPEVARRIETEAFATALAVGFWSGDVELVSRSGRRVPVHQIILSHTGSRGEPLLSTIARDITARLQTETLLRESEQRFRTTFEQASVGLAHLDLSRRILWVNAKLCDILGAPAGALLGRPFDALLGPEPEPFLAGFELLLAAAIPSWQGEERLLRRGASPVWAEVELTLARDERGRALYYVAVAADVTDRRRARETERRLAKVLESTPDFVGTMNAQRHAVYLNAAGRSMVGVGRDEVMAAEDVFRFHPPWARDMLERAVANVVAAGQTWVGESALLTRSGREIPVLQVIFAHRGLEDDQPLITTIARDISDLKRIQATLEEAKAEAERANHAKSEFLANMSHELRTPLNSVIGFAEMLADGHYGEVNDRQRQFLASILDSGHHLLDLINDILDLAKVDAGRLSLEPVELDAGILVRDLAGALAVIAARKGISLAVEAREGLPRVAADPRRLKQIALNLLSNAIKFTPEGGRIEVAVRASEERGEPGGLWLAVADSGIGIRAEDLPRLFQPFEQVDGSYHRSEQGTGLGLALTRRLVELHGGRVWAESAGPGRGSTFHVVLPACWAPAERAS